MDEEIRKRGNKVKTYKHVWNTLLCNDTLELAIVNAADGKNKNNERHRSLRHIKKYKECYVPFVRDWIVNYDPKEHDHKTKIINDGISAKKRKLTIPTYQEEIMLNAACLVFKQTLKPSMYEHSYSSIPGKGTHLAAKYISKWMKKDCVNTQYAFQGDIHHFFESVHRGILFKKLKRRYKDDKFLRFLWNVVYATPGVVGLPLGFPSSQWFSNFYMTDFDHYVKEVLKAPYYVRFSDDLLIMASNKEDLWRIKDAIEDYLEKELHLHLKSNWKIFPLDRSNPTLDGNKLDFIGYKYCRDYRILRKKILSRFRNKVRHVVKKGHVNIKDARQLVTYAGYLKHAKCHTWYKNQVKPYVNLKYLRTKISKYDKEAKRNEHSSRS